MAAAGVSRILCPVCQADHPPSRICVFECGHCTCQGCRARDGHGGSLRLPHVSGPDPRRVQRAIRRKRRQTSRRRGGQDARSGGELLIEALFRSISANAQDDIVRFATVFTVRCMQGHPEYLDLLRGVEDRSNYIEDSLRTRRFKIHSCLKSLTEFIQPPQAREGMQSLIQRIVATHGEAMVHWRRASDGLADRMLSVIGFEETAAAVRSCILQRDAERREDEE